MKKWLITGASSGFGRLLAERARRAMPLGAPRLPAGPRVPVPSGLSGRYRGPGHDRGNSAAYLLLYFHENRNPARPVSEEFRSGSYGA